MIDEITVLRVGVDVSVMTVIRADPGSALSTASLLDTSPFSVSLQCIYGQHYVSPHTSFSTHAVIYAHCGKTFGLVGFLSCRKNMCRGSKKVRKHWCMNSV